MVQLLLTRSPEQNTKLASDLGRPDIATFNVPLLAAAPLSTSPHAKALVMDLDQFDKIIFISKNAVIYGLPVLEQYWPQWPIHLEWLAVGPATSALLEDQDLSPVYPEQASSEGLLAMRVLTDEIAESNVLIVRGVGGRETLKEGLVARGAKVTYLEVYERVLVPHEASRFPDGAEVIALLYSGEAIQRLQELIGAAAKNYMLIVPSKRLQVLAIDCGFDKVEVARNQEDQSMLEVVTRSLEQYL